MLLTETIEIKWAGRTRIWYEGMGYNFTAYGDSFAINVIDIFPTSNATVTYKCDYCGIEKDAIYAKYMRNKNLSFTDACKNCIGQKVADSKAGAFKTYIESVYDSSDAIHKSIPLTHGEVAVVDSKHYDRIINLCRWAISAAGYAVGNIKQDGVVRQIPMHRIITGCPDGLEVEHINGDKLCNLDDNLKIVTRQENANSRIQVAIEGKLSQYKGVTLNKGRWETRIMLDGRLYRIGLFKDEVAAANAYNHFASYLYGDYASLNQCPIMDEEEWRRHSTSRIQIKPENIRRKQGDR